MRFELKIILVVSVTNENTKTFKLQSARFIGNNACPETIFSVCFMILSRKCFWINSRVYVLYINAILVYKGFVCGKFEQRPHELFTSVMDIYE